MRSRYLSLVFLSLGVTASAGCAHQGPAAPVGPQKQFQAAATQIRSVAYEDDFIEARLVFQALPAGVPERAALRQSLIRYLLEPIVALPAAELRRGASALQTAAVSDRLFESFRDALGLYEPVELWVQDPRAKISPVEQDLLGRTAKLVLALF